MTIKNRIITYGLLALVLFLALQLTLAWIKGVEWSPVQSLYRVKHKPTVIAPRAPEKGEKLATLPCVPLQVIEPSKGPLVASESPFITGRWGIPASRYGGVAEVAVNKEGKSALTFTQKDMGLAEIGRATYVTLWGSYGATISDQLVKRMSLKLELEKDLFRIGPLWTRGRVGGGWERTQMPDGEKMDGATAEVSLGLGVGL